MSYFNQHKNSGMKVWFVLGEDSAGDPPTLAVCQEWANYHGVDPSMVFLDNDINGQWQTTWSFMENYAQGSIGLPWEAVLKGKDMEYLFQTQGHEKDPESVLNALLDL